MQSQRTIGRPKGSKNGERTLIDVTCVRCGTTFGVPPAKAETRQYCSRECQYPGRPDGRCQWCGVPLSRYRKGVGRFCSTSCSAKAQGEKRRETLHRPPGFALRFLYTEEHLSTRAVAAFYGVSHKTVTRWLRYYAITRRPPHPGLASTGEHTPTAEDLRRMILEEHLSYEDIGAAYGINKTAVAGWLDKFEIPRPKTWETRYRGSPPTPPNEEELRMLYEEQGLATAEIAPMFNMSPGGIAQLCKSLGIPLRPAGYTANRFPCDDGHSVRSTYEQRVDNWLHRHGIPHEYEPRLPFDLRSMSDFLANGHYIEIWGVSKRDPVYAVRRERKTRLYHEHGLLLIELVPDAFSSRANGRWERILAKHLIASRS